MKNYVGLLTEKGIIAGRKDYDNFSLDITNRLINEEAIEDLLNDFNDDINEEEYPFMAPIVVYWDNDSQKGFVQQGHHRFVACMRTGRNINYILTNQRSVTKGQSSGHQDFKIHELVYSYMKQGSKHYEFLYNIHKDYDGFFSYTAIETAMFGGTKRKCDGATLKNGKMKFNKSDELTCKTVLDKYIELNNILNLGKASANSRVVSAIFSTLSRKDFDWNYFIKRSFKFTNIKDTYNLSTAKDVKGMFERIYNLSSRKTPFYF